MKLMMPSPRYPRLMWSAGITCCVGFCLMTVELLAGRIAAPFVGASIYTWTSVIGVVLAGVSLGNMIGGWIADKRSSPKVLGVFLMLAGPAALIIPLIAQTLGPALVRSSFSLPLITVFFALAVFLPVALLLSTIPPQAAKLAMADLNRSGSVVGDLGAWNAVGSIAGTFMTGFVFMMFFNTAHVITGVASFLSFSGLVVAFVFPRK